MTEFFVILGHFLPFDSPNNHKNQNFEKMKKSLEISLYSCVLQMTIMHSMVNLKSDIWPYLFFSQ